MRKGLCWWDSQWGVRMHPCPLPQWSPLFPELSQCPGKRERVVTAFSKHSSLMTLCRKWEAAEIDRKGHLVRTLTLCSSLTVSGKKGHSTSLGWSFSLWEIKEPVDMTKKMSQGSIFLRLADHQYKKTSFLQPSH